VKGIDHLRPLPDQKLADTEHHRGTLIRLALHGSKTHRRALRRFTDGFGIAGIILLALEKRFPVGRRNKPQLMTRCRNLPSPEMAILYFPYPLRHIPFCDPLAKIMVWMGLCGTSSPEHF
jgi:hypothetical protein